MAAASGEQRPNSGSHRSPDTLGRDLRRGLRVVARRRIAAGDRIARVHRRCRWVSGLAGGAPSGREAHDTDATESGRRRRSPCGTAQPLATMVIIMKRILFFLSLVLAPPSTAFA